MKMITTITTITTTNKINKQRKNLYVKKKQKQTRKFFLIYIFIQKVRGPFSCTAYQTASEYKLNSFDELRNFFKNENNYAIKIMGDIIHLQYERNVPRQLSDIPAVEIIDKRDNEPNSVEANTIVPFELQDDEELKVDNRRDIFYFTKEGCVVCWGTHPTEDLMWRNKIKPFEIEPSAVVIDESVRFSYYLLNLLILIVTKI